MSRLLLCFVFTFISCLPINGQTAGQNILQRRKTGGAPGFDIESLTLGNGQIIGRKVDGTLSAFTLGSGLTLTDSTITTTAGAGTGTVTSVAASVPTGFSISGSPVATTGTLAIGYSAGYQGYTTAEASKLSGIEALADVTDAANVAAAGALMTSVLGTGVQTALGVNIGTAGAVIVNGGAGGTPSSLTLTNASGLPWAGVSKTGSSLADLATRSASDLTSGTVATARLGTGTADSTTYLRGDNTWATITGNALTSGTLDQFADVTQTAGQTLSITSSTTLAGGSHSGTNTGDNATNSQYSGLVSNATHTGDATGSTALTVVGINGTTLSGLTTGLLKNTTGTGVPSIALAGTDYLTPSGNGSALTGITSGQISGLGTLATQNGTFSGTSSGTNTGDNATNSQYSGLVSNATHTGDATGATALTVVAINGTTLSTLGTGLLKNTTGTGVPSIATAGTDYLTPSGAADSFQPLDAQLTSLAGISYTGNNLKVIRVNAGENGFELASVGTGDALTSGTLDQFADVTQTAGKTLAITDNTTLAGGSHSGTNTGDNATNSQYSSLVSNATHTGDATGSVALTVVGINGTALSGLTTGLLKNTTGTGVPSIALAGTDYLVPSGNGSALTGITANQISGLGTLATQSGTFSGTSSGTNTGDNATNSQYSGLVSNATHTGDATGDTALTVVRINGTSLAGLATGILKNTTGTGVPSIAVAGTDYEIAGAAAAITPTTLGLVIGTNVQAYDADLTTYAGITPSANIQSLLGAANYAAVSTQLSLNNVENTALSTWGGSTNITTLGTIVAGTWNGTIIAPAYLGTGSSITTKFLRGDGTWQTIGGGGDALTTNPLSQFASTTSAQLRGVLSDESGTGEFLTTTGSAANLTSFPTFNQNTSGSAAKLTTARTINGVSFDGSANVADYATDAAGSDTYAISLSPAPAAYITNAHYRFIAGTANTGAATININSLGAKTIKKAAGGITTDLADNDIRAGQAVDIVYDGTNMQMQSLLGNAPGGGGGGGLTNITETLHTASPNNTVNAEQLAVTGGTTNVDLVLTPKGTGAFILRNVPDGTGTYGNKRGDYAVDLQMQTNVDVNVASGANSFAVGSYGKATASHSMALGQYNYVTNAHSFAAGYSNVITNTQGVAMGGSNTVSGTNSVAIGSSNNVSVPYAAAFGYGNTVNGYGSSLAAGYGNNVFGDSAVAIGYQNTADSYASQAFGYYAKARHAGMMAKNAYGGFGLGGAQYIVITHTATTTNATPAETGGNWNAGEVYTIPSGQTHFLNVMITGASSTNTASYQRQVCIRNTAGTTAIVGSVVTLGSDNETDAAWDIAITANDTNDALRIQVTGAAATTIRWLAAIQGTELKNP